MKNQYDLLNGSSVDFDEYEEIELTASEKKRMNKRLKRDIKPVRKKARPLIAAAVLLLAVTPVMMETKRYGHRLCESVSKLASKSSCL